MTRNKRILNLIFVIIITIHDYKKGAAVFKKTKTISNLNTPQSKFYTAIQSSICLEIIKLPNLVTHICI